MSVSGAIGIIFAAITNIDTRVNGCTLVLSSSESADGSITWNWDVSSTDVSQLYP